MPFEYRDGVALLQLLVFVPSAPIALFLCFRHGLSKSSGWRFAFMFCLLRIAGAIAQMVTISHPTRNAYATILVCNSIGLSPLNLLCVGLLSRLNDQITRRIKPTLFKVVELLSLAGLILAIYGGAAHQDTATQYTFGTNPVTKAAVIVFAVVLLASVVMFGMMLTRKSEIPRGEKRLLVVIAIAEPLVLIRLTYAMLFIFGAGMRWNTAFGDVTAYLCMAVLEEIVVITVALGVGLTLKKIPKAVVSGEYDEVELQFQHGKDGEPIVSNRRQKAKGPISWLIFAAIDAVKNSKRR